ncbi:MAG: galactose mutarotase [Siculibacillus sp.]|nr:galactose mutarotase [Siculibacillus sp.]
MAVGEFGRVGGETVHEITLRSPGGATASIVTLGAALRALAVPLGGGGMRQVVLGFDTAEAYADNPGHLGAMIGRVANRIAGGRFRLDGRTHDLPINEAGNTLHGGPGGFTRRNWSIVAASETAVELSLISEDGDQGFPGRLEVRCRYALSDVATLAITATATTDAPTPVNLTNHAYFTMNGAGDCRAHVLRIPSDFYTPVDAVLIPTGEIAPVAGSAYDFRVARPIGVDHDIAFVVAGAPGEMAFAAEVTAPDGRMRLEVATDQPSLQFYTAQHLGPHPAAASGLAHGRNAGFCLEAQGFVDAPNERHFPSVTLRPGAVYRHATTYRFVAL